jgi:hypothetical protein
VLFFVGAILSLIALVRLIRRDTRAKIKRLIGPQPHGG